MDEDEELDTRPTWKKVLAYGGVAIGAALFLWVIGSSIVTAFSNWFG